MWNWTNDKRRGGAVCGLAFVLACCVVPSASMACEVAPSAETRAELMAPIELRPDGSFRVIVDTGAYELLHGGFAAKKLFGGAILNIGEGRIGQKISDHEGCSGTDERLMFVDCNGLEAIIIDGIESPDDEEDWMWGTFIANIQYPKGPIGFTKDTTVPKVEAIAKKHGFSYSRDVYGDYDFLSKKKRYNPYQGCKIFYPDSPGAKR